MNHHSEGSPNSKIAIIGEAWGEMEERLGKPFVGPAGQLLNDLLRQSGISRSDCYITNVIKERPSGNKISHFINFSKAGYPCTKAYLDYVKQLKEELTECKANIFIALGNVPLFALTGLLAITKRRGSILESTLVKGRKVIPVIHPSSVLHGAYMYRYYIEHDLKRALRQSTFPEIKPIERHLKISPSYWDVLAYLHECKKVEMIGFDIEVVNEEVSCISFAISSTDVISIPFTRGINDYFTLEEEAQIWKDVAVILEDTKIIKVGQNILFDSSFLFWKYGIRTAVPMQDTMVAQGILFPDFPKGLDFITSIYTDLAYYKDEGKKRIKGLGCSDHDYWVYNAKDSVVLMDAFPKIYSDLEKTRNIDAYHRQISIIEPLLYMMCRALRIDTDGIRIESDNLAKRIEVLREKIQDMTGDRITNPNSVKQGKDYFYIYRGIKPYIKRSTRAVRLDEDALKRISRKGYKEAEALLELRKLVKLKGTYLDVKLNHDGRLGCSFNPVGTKNGRFSSSKTIIFETGTNIQTLPPAMKKYVLADIGYIMFSVDLAQAENRIVAYIAPEATMISAFEKGIDIHNQTAGLIFGKPPGDISDEDGSSPFKDGKSERFWGKKANHGLNYGLGYRSFALEYEIPEAQAKYIVGRYHAIYPGVRQYQAWIKQELYLKGRTLTNCYGRKRIFMDRWSDKMFRDASNFIPQSTVADKINQDGVAFIWKNISEVELLNQVHDSIVFQIRLDVDWEQIAHIILRIKKSLEIPIRWKTREFVIPVDLKMGMNMKDMVEIDIKGGWFGIALTMAKEYERMNDGSEISNKS